MFDKPTGRASRNVKFRGETVAKLGTAVHKQCLKPRTARKSTRDDEMSPVVSP